MHHRVTAPLFATVDGHTVRAADWSLGGLRLVGFPGDLPSVGDTVQLHISLPFQGFEVAFDTGGQVVRNDAGAAMFAIQFIGLGDRERELMSHFIEEIVRGSMVDVEDTIQRIDVPVTPVSTKPDPNPIAEIPTRRIPVKTIVMSVFYLMLGFFVFGYLGVMVYANYFRMEVQTAVISAPLESVKALFDGRIVWAEFRPGSRVRTGDILLNVADNDLEKEIDFARIAIDERRGQLDFLRRKQADELSRMEGLADISLKNIRQRKLEVDALAAAAAAAGIQSRRLAGLMEQGYTTKARAEEAEAAWVDARKRLASRRLELETSSRLASAYLGKRHFTGTNFVGEVGRIDAEISLAESRIGIATARHDVLLRQRARLAVRAPFDGMLLELPRVNLASVRQGDTVAVIEQREARRVTAYLRQDEVLKVGLGDRAYGYIPALNESQPLVVVDIDRTTGFVDEQNSSYKWRGSQDRSAQVTLEFENPQMVADARRYRSGLPVIVLFEQRSTSHILSEIERRLKLLKISITGSGGSITGRFGDRPAATYAPRKGAAIVPRKSLFSGTARRRKDMISLLGLKPDGHLDTTMPIPASVTRWLHRIRSRFLAASSPQKIPGAAQGDRRRARPS